MLGVNVDSSAVFGGSPFGHISGYIICAKLGDVWDKRCWFSGFRKAGFLFPEYGVHSRGLQKLRISQMAMASHSMTKLQQTPQKMIL